MILESVVRVRVLKIKQKVMKKIIMLVMAIGMTNCVMSQDKSIGLHLDNMNPQMSPGNDFYEYACGGWRKANPLKPEYSRFGSFDAIAEQNREQQKELILELAAGKHEKGSVAQKIGDLYNMVMDSARQNKDGVKPVMKDLETIEKTKNRKELISLFMKNDADGLGFIFGVGIGADMMNSKMNLLGIGQGGLTLGNKDYYTKDDEATKKIREGFKKHIVNMFKLVGDNEKTATRKMESVMAIENKVAEKNKTRTELRDPATNYHKMSFADLQKDYPGFPWEEYFANNFITDVDFIDVGQPEAIKNDIEILNTIPVRQLKDWMQWKVLSNSSGVLGDVVYAEYFDFFGRQMSGKQEIQPRWKRAVSACNVLGEAVGQMYVQKYFPAENKARMKQLVKNLQIALGQRIDQQDWMSEETKKVAKDKLNAFYVKIGYPDKWKDYSKLNIDPTLTRYELSKVIAKWACQKEVEEKYKKPVDRDEWHMTPQTVNAYYNPTTNEICFPAGILQYPFFDMSADDAFNYGAIGVVIGHEMTHGFDDQGSQFDKDGNFNNWWAESDKAKFKERTQKMVEFFDKIEVLPGLHANGTLTQGENIADHGGLKIAYLAFKNATKDNPLPVKNGLTADQRFFLAYASVWAQNITEENMRQLTTMDPHSLGEWRVNGALPQIDAWYEAFGIKPGDKMYIPKEDRVNVW